MDEQFSVPNSLRIALRRFLISTGLFTVAIAACIYAFTHTQQVDGSTASPKLQERVPHRESQLDQFPPVTDAERELEKVLRGKNEEIDLALANWLIAADVPQFRDMTREMYFKQLDAMTEQVRQDMVMMRPVVKSRGGNPDTSHARCSIFCGAMIRLKFDYREEFRRENLTPEQMGALYSDPDNIFLAGLIRTRRGSCVSMPLIYLVIGRRLGLPVHLVAVGKHYFIRWQEPDYRMNIEATIVEKVCMTPDDSTYLNVEGMTRDQLQESEMRNLTPREIIGNLFFARDGYWAAKGPQHKNERRRDLFRARLLAPDDPAIKAVYNAIFSNENIQP